MKNTFDPALLYARIYQPGSSNAKPFKIGLDRGEIIITDLQGTVVDELQGDDWNLSVGGTSDERVILKHVDHGHTIVTDLEFLNVLASDTNSPHLREQARKLKKGDIGRSVSRSSGMIALILMLMFFVTWVIIGFSYRSHDRAATRTSEVSEQEQQPVDDVADENATDGQKYMKLIEPVIKEGWVPPRSSKHLSTVFRYSISRDGHISHVKVFRSSGEKEFDAHGIAALKRVRKLPPPPASLGAPLEVEFTFTEDPSE